MQANLLEILIIAAYVMALGGLICAVRVNINYRLTPEHLLITMMGFVVRKIRLDDIESISTPSKGVWWAESWINTFTSDNRRLVIQRKSGWVRRLVITPRYRFVFRHELVEARKTLMALLSDPGLRGVEFHVFEPVQVYRSAPALSPALSRG